MIYRYFERFASWTIGKRILSPCNKLQAESELVLSVEVVACGASNNKRNLHHRRALLLKNASLFPNFVSFTDTPTATVTSVENEATEAKI